MFFPASIYLEVKNHWQQKHDNRIPSSSPIQGIRRFIVTPLRPAESGRNVLKGQIHKEDQRLYPGDLHDLWSKVVTHLYVTRTDNSDWWFSSHVSCLRYSKSELMRKSCRKRCACLTVSSWLLDRGKREKERERMPFDHLPCINYTRIVCRSSAENEDRWRLRRISRQNLILLRRNSESIKAGDSFSSGRCWLFEFVIYFFFFFFEIRHHHVYFLL